MYMLLSIFITPRHVNSLTAAPVYQWPTTTYATATCLSPAAPGPHFIYSKFFLLSIVFTICPISLVLPV